MRRSALPLALALLAAAPAAEARGRAHRCRETAPVPVIGRAKCHTFGRWDVTTPVFTDAMSVGLEIGWHRLLMSPRTLGADLTVNQKTTSFALSGDKIGLPRADIGAGRLSFEAFRVGPVRVGPAFEVGGAGLAGQAFPLQGLTYSVTSAFYGSVGANLAAGVGAGPLFLRTELFGGIQYLLLATESGAPPPAHRPPLRPQFATFPTGGGGSSGPPPDGLALSEPRFRLAPRVSVEVWTSDYLTLGVAGAVDVIHRDDFMLGGFLRSYLDPRGMSDPRTH